MRRISDTELVRNYCEKHIGDIFDINYASENIFVDIPHVNLRKIISRLIDAGLLRTISKGVYAIGESSLSDEERVIKHYLTNEFSLPAGIEAGSYLLYKKGLLSIEPVEKVIKSNMTKGNKKIGNVQIIESHNVYGLAGHELIIAMELLSADTLKDQSLVEKWEKEIQTLLKGYTDMQFKAVVKDLYQGRTYYLLEQFLNTMQISHRVKEIYEIQVRLHSKE